MFFAAFMISSQNVIKIKLFTCTITKNFYFCAEISKSMKKFALYLLILGLLFNLSCKKEEPGAPAAIAIPAGIIQSISITDGQQNVGVYDTIVVVANYFFNSHTTLSNGEVIGVRVGSITLTDNGESVPVQYDVANNRIRIYPKNIFKENAEPYTLNLNFNVYRYDGSTPVICETTAQTSFKYNFSTKLYGGAAGISELNIAQCYPAINQYHYLPKESSTGFLVLKPSTEIYINTDRWEHFVKFYRKDVEIFSSAAQYDQTTHTFTFDTPQDLSPETIYSYTLFQKPKDSNAQDQVSTVFQVHFRTSKYNTFQEKWSTFSSSSVYESLIYSTVHSFSVVFTLGEALDKYEEKALDGLIRFSKDTSDYNYKKEKFMYDGFALYGYTLEKDTRNSLYKIPPLNAFFLTERHECLTQQQIISDEAPTIVNSPDTLTSYVYIAMYLDWTILKNEIEQKTSGIGMNNYENMVMQEGYKIYVGEDVLSNYHAQYYARNKMTSDVMFNW